MRVNKQVVALIGLFTVAVSLFFPPNILMGRVLTLLGLLSIIYPILRSLKTSDYHISILYIFFLSYMVVPTNYFWLGKHIINYYQCETLQTVYVVLQIMCVFHFILLYGIKFTKKHEVRIETKIEDNPIIFQILILLSLAFTTFGQSGSTIFDTGSYADTNEVVSYSGFFAYSVIPTTLACIYANTKKRRIITYIAIAYFVAKNFIYGGRVDSIQLLLAVFLIRFQYIWSKKKILLYCAVGGLFVAFWGAIRSDVSVDMAEAFLEVVSGYFTQDSSIDFQVGNAPEVYYSSIKIIYLIEKGILTVPMRLLSFVCLFLSVVIPGSMLPDVANLSTFMRDEYYNGGGGLVPVFFYAFLGWIGVVLFAWFIMYCINKYNEKGTSKYFRFYLILLMGTTPRWYAYYPLQLIKFCVIGALFYYFLEIMIKPPVKKNKRTLDNGAIK